MGACCADVTPISTSLQEVNAGDRLLEDPGAAGGGLDKGTRVQFRNLASNSALTSPMSESVEDNIRSATWSGISGIN